MALPPNTSDNPLPEAELDGRKAASAELYKQIREGAKDAAKYGGPVRSQAIRDYAYAYRLVAGGQQPGTVPENR